MLLLALNPILSSKIYGITIPSEKHQFKSTDREINFDIERKQGEVALFIQSSGFSNYEEVDIERSGNEVSGYTVCKTLEPSKIKVVDGYFATADNFPLPAKVNSYYRVKTIAKDGSVRVYPPTMLPALVR